MDVVEASSVDLRSTLDWLQKEYEDFGYGFWVNREIIENAFENGNLFVAKICGEVIGLQVGRLKCDIVAVRPDKRNLGVGTALFEALVERARANDINVIFGECAPADSLEFWLKRGFVQYNGHKSSANPLVRYFITRDYEVPEGFPLDRVQVSFYPEHVLYNELSAPVSIHNVNGVRDGYRVRLDRRVVGMKEDLPNGSDLVVKVQVNEKVIYFEKAKRSKAETVGIVLGIDGTYYIDWINCADCRLD